MKIKLIVVLLVCVLAIYIAWAYRPAGERRRPVSNEASNTGLGPGSNTRSEPESRPAAMPTRQPVNTRPETRIHPTQPRSYSYPSDGIWPVDREPNKPVLEWLSLRDAGVKISQTQKGKLNYPGTIEWEGLTASLGGGPPRFHHQLKANQCAILLGQRDSRNSFKRSVWTVRPVDGKLELRPELSVSFPELGPDPDKVSPAGFVFHRDEMEISNLGIIIPDIKRPPGADPTSPDWAVNVRIEPHRWRNRSEPEIYVSHADLEKIVPQSLDSEILLMPSAQPGLEPRTARVLWFKLNDQGSFERVK